MSNASCSDHMTVALCTEGFTVFGKEQTVCKPVAAFLSSAQSIHATHLADKTLLMPFPSHRLDCQVRYRQLAPFALWLVQPQITPLAVRMSFLYNKRIGLFLFWLC